MKPSLGSAVRVAVYALVAEFVVRGIALAPAPPWPYRLGGYALTLAALLLAAYGPPVGESIEEWVKRRQREARRREGDR